MMMIACSVLSVVFCGGSSAAIRELSDKSGSPEGGKEVLPSVFRDSFSREVGDGAEILPK
ncbi:hypothetical protein EHO60_07565 [Leptospira fletcheri]|uniref:Uncharacterized protein n=1 Tax=Leptospira fletcheri TaxID=2484981 RepID=A0A4R9GHD1_9LEPT|nr:hypothetical protein [Leptospira fletcheri]TGK12118.1 hypothetical protein EHO60_07565 [Leptospira fletcheri]